MKGRQSVSALPRDSHVNLFRYGESVVDFDTKIPDGAFDLGMAQKELHRSEISGTAVDQGRFGSS